MCLRSVLCSFLLLLALMMFNGYNVNGYQSIYSLSATHIPQTSVTFMTIFEYHWYLEGYLELGSSLGVPCGLVGCSLDFHRHGEDWSMYWAGLGEQAVLQAWVDLVQTHQSVHGVVWISHPPVRH